jgi:hypothetical protein
MMVFYGVEARHKASAECQATRPEGASAVGLWRQRSEHGIYVA